MLQDGAIDGTTNDSSFVSSNKTFAANAVAIDPTMTMDWTTMNPPDVKEGGVGSELEDSLLMKENEEGSSLAEQESGSDGSETEHVTEPFILYNDDDDDVSSMVVAANSMEDSKVEDISPEDNGSAGMTKEAVSPPYKMDTDPERPHNDTATTVVVTEMEEETESDAPMMYSELEAANDESVIAASKGESQGSDTLTGYSNETNTTAAALTNSSTATTTTFPTDNTSETTTPHPIQTEIYSISTSSPTLVPTVENVESSEDSLDHAANKPTVKNDDVSLDDDDAVDEEESPSTTAATTAGGVDEDWDATKDEIYKEEEEEVKKVGGILTFASIILMVYTAYQMSENPDGICAR